MARFDVKLAFYTFNIIFAVTCVLIVLACVLFQLNHFHVYYIFEKTITVSLLTLLATVLIALVIAFLGCCGAMQRAPKMLIVFTILLTVVFISQLSLGVFILVQWHYDLSYYNQALAQYFNDRTLFGAIEEEYGCCGVYGPADYQTAFRIPSTCCIKHTDNCALIAYNIYTVGCSKAVQDAVESHGVAIGAIAVSFCVFEITEFILSVMFLKIIKQSSSPPPC